ncbi:MAG: hypothetical protein AABY22_34615 [Nanoarchaeota archaeon]
MVDIHAQIQQKLLLCSRVTQYDTFKTSISNSRRWILAIKSDPTISFKDGPTNIKKQKILIFDYEMKMMNDKVIEDDLDNGLLLTWDEKFFIQYGFDRLILSPCMEHLFIEDDLPYIKNLYSQLLVPYFPEKGIINIIFDYVTFIFLGSDDDEMDRVREEYYHPDTTPFCHYSDGSPMFD